MKHLKVSLLVLLLAATLGMVVSTGYAELPSRPASPCAYLGCEGGGADFCASIMFIVNNVVVVYTCYTRYAS